MNGSTRRYERFNETILNLREAVRSHSPPPGRRGRGGGPDFCVATTPPLWGGTPPPSEEGSIKNALRRATQGVFIPDGVLDATVLFSSK